MLVDAGAGVLSDTDAGGLVDAGAGVLVDASADVHGHGVLAVPTYAVLPLGGLELPPKKDEIIAGIARTPDADEVDIVKTVLSDGQGHMHVEPIAGRVVRTWLVAAGAGCADGVIAVGVEPVWPQGKHEPAAGGRMPVPKLVPWTVGAAEENAMDGGAAAGGIGAAEMSGVVGAVAV